MRVAIFVDGANMFYAQRDNVWQKRVVCVGRKQSTSLEMINIANDFIDLNSIRKDIEKIRGGGHM